MSVGAFFVSFFGYLVVILEFLPDLREDELLSESTLALALRLGVDLVFLSLETAASSFLARWSAATAACVSSLLSYAFLS